MTESQNPERRLAMNTDWVSAIGMVLLFALCAFFAGHGTWRLFHGEVHSVDTSWPIILAALFFLYIGIAARVKELKILFVLLALGPISKALLWKLKAPMDIQNMNSVFVGWIDVVVYVGVAAYILWWFKRNTITVNEGCSTTIDPRP